jgi:hypothetical protein
LFRITTGPVEVKSSAELEKIEPDSVPSIFIEDDDVRKLLFFSSSSPPIKLGLEAMLSIVRPRKRPHIPSAVSFLLFAESMNLAQFQTLSLFPMLERFASLN